MSTSQARQYLERVLPWPPVGDANCWYNIHWRAKGEHKPYWHGLAAKTLDELVGIVEWCGKTSSCLDIYVCMSSQRTSVLQQKANGRATHKAVRSADNAVELRSLFLDIDVKKGAYEDTSSALKALKEFTERYSLPFPNLIVTTGSGGLHCYWTLNEALSKNNWQGLANALAEAVKEFGLHADTQCTVDSARILRVPGTVNNKIPGQPRPVSLASKHIRPHFGVDEIRVPLQKFLNPQALIPLPSHQLGGIVDNLGAGINRESRPVRLDTIKGCGFIDEALDTGGRNFLNPLWNLTTLLATFCEDGEEQAHKMAAGHPDYDRATTAELYTRKLRERTEKNLGWPQCKTIHLSGCKSCGSCPNLAHNKSPLNLGMAAPGAVVEETILPHGYHRDAGNGRIYMVDPKDGKAVIACPFKVQDGWIQTNPWTLHFSTQFHVDDKHWVPISLTMEELSTGDTWLKRFGKQGIVFPEHFKKSTKDFLVAWIERLREHRTSVVSSSPFGWMQEHGKLTGFTFGGRTYSKTDERQSAMPSDVLSHMYTPCGDLEVWRKAEQLITNQKRPEIDAILAASFAAPLVRFTGASGLICSAFSPESGIGKSTAMKVAQAVWGNPVTAMQSLDDTTNSVVKKIGDIQALPMFWDEMKTDDDLKRFCSFTFQLSGGKSKSRLNAQADYQEITQWNTLLMAASNDSLVDSIQRSSRSSVAGLYRVFEFRVAPWGAQGKIGLYEASAVIQQIEGNYGRAGELYSKFLGQNYDVIEAQIHDKAAKLQAKLGLQEDERLWGAAVITLMMGASYANMLGLTHIDTKVLYQFLTDTLANLRSVRKDSSSDLLSGRNVSEILQQYLSENMTKGIIRTDRTWIGTGRPPKNQIQIKSDPTRIQRLVGSISEDDGILRLSNSALRDWLAAQGYNPTIFIKSLQTELHATTVLGHLGAGTSLATVFREHIWHIDIVGTGLVT